MDQWANFGDSGSESVRVLLKTLDLANVCVRDLDGTIRFWSSGNEVLYGWSAAEAVGRATHALLHTHFPVPLPEIEIALLKNGQWTGELQHRRKDGRLVEVASHWVHQLADDGSHRVVEVNNDISDRRRADDAVQYLASIVRSSDDAIISKDLNGIVTSWNQGAERLFGYTAEEMVGHSVLRLFPPELTAEELMVLDSIAKGHDVKHYETERLSKSGSRLAVSVCISPIKDSRGQIVGAAKIVRNISERKSTEETLKRSLEEKAALMQEVHHRVKNNLAVVAGLLSLQAESSDDPKLTQKLRDSERRVLSMAAIHDLLYRHENVSRVELAQYIRNLTAQLFASYTSGPGLSYKLDLTPVEVTVDQAVPCALILNELVTNAIKYAYPGGQGEVAIRLIQGNDDVQMTVADHGVGLPPATGVKTVSTLGLLLIGELVHQLEGRLESSGPPGTSFTIIFPRPFSEERTSDTVPVASTAAI